MSFPDHEPPTQPPPAEPRRPKPPPPPPPPPPGFGIPETGIKPPQRKRWYEYV